MNEIKCPNCGEVFTIDENAYASIVKQIRDSEFQSELAEREKMFKNEKDSALALVKTQLREENEKSIFELKQEIIAYLKARKIEYKDFGCYDNKSVDYPVYAKLVGKAIAEKAVKAGVEAIAFDRGGYLYHGRVKSLAEGAREGGLKF